MGKFIVLLSGLYFVLCSSIVCAITENEKLHIENIIDEAYRYNLNAESEARSRARKYIENQYNHLYFRCMPQCIDIQQQIQSSANHYSLFLDVSKIRQEANEAYVQCMKDNCDNYLDIEVSEGIDYIDNYIKSKRK